MKTRYLCSIIFSLTLLAAISGCNHEVTSTGELTPEQLANVGARLYVTPDNQSAILADAKMTESEFRTQIENISTNIEASARYRKAFEQELQDYHK